MSFRNRGETRDTKHTKKGSREFGVCEKGIIPKGKEGGDQSTFFLRPSRETAKQKARLGKNRKKEKAFPHVLCLFSRQEEGLPNLGSLSGPCGCVYICGICQLSFSACFRCLLCTLPPAAQQQGKTTPRRPGRERDCAKSFSSPCE